MPTNFVSPHTYPRLIDSVAGAAQAVALMTRADMDPRRELPESPVVELAVRHGVGSAHLFDVALECLRASGQSGAVHDYKTARRSSTHLARMNDLDGGDRQNGYTRVSIPARGMIWYAPRSQRLHSVTR